MTNPSHSLDRLFQLVIRLRSPQGCPWDREQELEDLRSYLLEEAHEVAAAIDSGDWSYVAAELGDLLFQIVFITRLAEEREMFDFDRVVGEIERKMVERHPHVFGDERLADSEAVHRAWEQRKLDEATGRRRSLLDGLPQSLPSLLAAYRMGQKAAGVGFDWQDAEAVLSKVDEELLELRHEIDRRDGSAVAEALQEELGDLLFTLANLARHLDMDPEAALALANAKFRCRFAAMEAMLADKGLSASDLDAQTLEAAWAETKASRGG